MNPAAEDLIGELVTELMDRITAELEAAYEWGTAWAGRGFEIDPFVVVHQRANVIEDLIRATSQADR